MPEEDVNGLLEGALRERAGLGVVDAVARDGHEVPARGHAVAQRRQVPVVDVPARGGASAHTGRAFMYGI